jgi:hypothetical protein
VERRRRIRGQRLGAAASVCEESFCFHRTDGAEQLCGQQSERAMQADAGWISDRLLKRCSSWGYKCHYSVVQGQRTGRVWPVPIEACLWVDFKQKLNVTEAQVDRAIRCWLAGAGAGAQSTGKLCFWYRRACACSYQRFIVCNTAALPPRRLHRLHFSFVPGDSSASHTTSLAHNRVCLC